MLEKKSVLRLKALLRPPPLWWKGYIYWKIKMRINIKIHALFSLQNELVPVRLQNDVLRTCYTSSRLGSLWRWFHSFQVLQQHHSSVKIALRFLINYFNFCASIATVATRKCLWAFNWICARWPHSFAMGSPVWNDICRADWLEILLGLAKGESGVHTGAITITKGFSSLTYSHTFLWFSVVERSTPVISSKLRPLLSFLFMTR